MSAATAENQLYIQSENEELCLWKIVLENNLAGVGTSFDPTNLNTSVCFCLECNGYNYSCRRYQT